MKMSNRLSEVFPKSLGNNMDLDQTNLSSHTGSRSEFRQVTNIPMLSCPVFFLFKNFLKVTWRLQLLQSIGCVPRAAPQAWAHHAPVVCASLPTPQGCPASHGAQ